MSKVRFGLKNVHYAVLTETESGGVISYSWATPVAVPGAVSLTLDANMNINNFHADNGVWFSSNGTFSLSGALEVAKVPDAMLTDVFGYALDSTAKVLVKHAQKTPVRFALLYQVDGDVENDFFVLYNCTATDPNAGSATTTDTVEPQTQSMTITAVPLSDNTCIGRTSADTPTAVKNGWFSAVWRSGATL